MTVTGEAYLVDRGWAERQVGAEAGAEFECVSAAEPVGGTLPFGCGR